MVEETMKVYRIRANGKEVLATPINPQMTFPGFYKRLEEEWTSGRIDARCYQRVLHIARIYIPEKPSDRA